MTTPQRATKDAPAYLAVIGDLIASRSIAQRNQAQQQLAQAIEQVNQRFAGSLAARFVITLGDEFQGLFLPTAPVFAALDHLEAAIHPLACRFGIGIGSMSTSINPQMSIGADGPAFWLARDAIASVHQDNDYGQTRTRLFGLPGLHRELVNNQLALSDHIKRGFTGVQQATYAALLQQGIYGDSFDQQQAAGQLGITPEALYRRLKLSGIKAYLRSRADLQTWLRSLMETEA